MIKSELIELLAKNNKEIPEKDIFLGVNLLLGYMTDSLTKGNRIELRGFGSFSLHHRPPRQAHNPKTMQKTVSKEKYASHFKPGKELRNRVNESRLHVNIVDDDSYGDEFE